jgi:hypothetical protein
MGVEADRPLTSRREVPSGPLFWTAVAVGWAVIGFGIVGALTEANRSHPRSLGIWLVGCLVAHDFILAPMVFAVGKTLRRVTSGLDRGLLQACLFLFGVIFLTSIPVLGRFGQRPDNPTLMPRDYGLGLIVTLVAVWLATTSVFLVIGWRRRR